MSAEYQVHRVGDTSVASQLLQPHPPKATPRSNGHLKDDPKGLAPTASPDGDGGYNCNGVQGKVEGKAGDAQPHQTAAESLKTKLRRDALRTKFLAASGHLSEDQVRTYCCREHKQCRRYKQRNHMLYAPLHTNHNPHVRTAGTRSL